MPNFLQSICTANVLKCDIDLESIKLLPLEAAMVEIVLALIVFEILLFRMFDLGSLGQCH